MERIDADGRQEFIGMNGFSWGKVLVGDWPLFCWQETLRLLEKELPAGFYARHRARLLELLGRHEAAAREHLRQEPQPFRVDTHNLFVWKSLLLYRAGQLWEQPAWRQLGDDLMGQAVAAQHAEGWWSEGGPTVGYNLVTATAVSLYSEWSGETSALDAMEKAARYHDLFSYDDGSMVEAMDGRMRYHHQAMAYVPPTFARFAEGRAYLRKALPALPAGEKFQLTDMQGFSFLGFTYEHLCEEPAETPTATAQARRVSVKLTGLASGVLQTTDWNCALCGLENASHASGFRLDRQNLLSVWHRCAGLVVGGGHSKLQPEFSNFQVIDREGIVHYLHHEPRIQVDHRQMTLDMRYGGLPVLLQIELPDERRAVIRCAARDFSEELFARFVVRAQLILVAQPGRTLRGQNRECVLEEKCLQWTAEDFGDWLECGHWRLRMSPRQHESAMIRWPVLPFNSYRADRKSELSAAALQVSAQLFPVEPSVEWRLELIET